MGALEDQLYTREVTKKKVLIQNEIEKATSNSTILNKGSKQNISSNTKLIFLAAYLPEFDYHFQLQQCQWCEEQEWQLKVNDDCSESKQSHQNNDSGFYWLAKVLKLTPKDQ